MAKISSATRRFRTTKGACYLTHGADSYDKRGLNKARRSLDQAAIAEQLEDHGPDEDLEDYFLDLEQDMVEFHDRIAQRDYEAWRDNTPYEDDYEDQWLYEDRILS